MRMMPLILLIALALSILTPYYMAESIEGYKVDGGILSEVFIDFLRSIEAGNISIVEYKYRIISNTTLPSDLEYIHRKTYSRLYGIALEAYSLNMELADAVTNSTPELVDSLRSHAINLYSDRLSIGEVLNEYIEAIGKYIPGGEGVYYGRELKNSVESFLLYLDNLITRTSDVIKELEMRYNINILTIELGEIESVAPAASTISIPLKFICHNVSLVNNTLIVDLNIGWNYIKRYTFNLTSLRNTTVNILLPDSSELYRHHLITKGGYIPVYGVVSLKTEYNDTVVIAGRSTFRFQIRVYKPSIIIRVPSISYYMKPINISIASNLDTPVDASIYIDNGFYENITIVPGRSCILLSYNISKGYHTIIFDIHASGRYTSIRYSASLAVTGKPVKAFITYPHESIQPFTGFRIYGALKNGEYIGNPILTIYVDDREVFSRPVGRSFNIDISIPDTLFISRYHLKILYGPDDPYYDPYILETDILVINILGVILFSFIGLAGVYIGLSFEREIIIKAVSTGLRGLYEAARGRYRVRERFKELVITRLSRSIAAEIYWRFIYRFSSIFPRPYDNETLREYLARASSGMKEFLRSEFRRLTLLVERDLYSRHRVERDEVEDIMRRIRDELE